MSYIGQTISENAIFMVIKAPPERAAVFSSAGGELDVQKVLDSNLKKLNS